MIARGFYVREAWARGALASGPAGKNAKSAAAMAGG
jgi:hypothetical protein